MDARDIDKAREDRAELKRKYHKAFDQLSALLFKHDPIGIAFETNTDEYEPEAGTILPRLHHCASYEDVLNVVCEEFIKWFGVEYGEQKGYTEIARSIWNERQFFCSLPN